MGDMNITGLGMGLSAMAGVMRYQQANAEYEQAKVTASLDAQSAQSALMGTLRSLEGEQKSAAEQALSTSIDVQKASAVAKGQATAEAGASGTSGSGVDKTVNNATLEASRIQSKTAINLESKQRELNTAAEVAVTQGNQRIQPMQVQKPNPWTVAVESGVSGFRNVVSLRALQRQRRLL